MTRPLARIPSLAALLAATLFLAGCHSYHIDATVENHTGADVQLLEVDYPSASFGLDRLSSGADFHYRFQVRGSGPVKVSYTDPGGKQIQIAGPTLVERQQGQFSIILMPNGKAQFIPQLVPSS